MLLSAGILVHRRTAAGREVLLGHPGGPLWRERDLGAWSIPKGLVERGETPLEAAMREFREETGLALEAPLTALTPIRQKGGKLVMGWAAEADLDLSRFRSSTFQMQWPPRSGRLASFPEINQLRYFCEVEALERILPAQAPLIVEALAIG